MMSAFNFISEKTNSNKSSEKFSQNHNLEIKEENRSQEIMGNNESLKNNQPKMNENQQDLINYQDYFQTNDELPPENNIHEQIPKGDSISEPIKPMKQ